MAKVLCVAGHYEALRKHSRKSSVLQKEMTQTFARILKQEHFIYKEQE